MQYRYHFLLGRKGKSYELSISFPKSAYHHLAGFHYSGIMALRNRNKALDVILNEEVTRQKFEKVGYLPEDRWTGLCRLQEMLENNKAVFRYRGHERIGSNIAADYLFSDNETVFFVNAGMPASIFGQNTHEYERNCPRMLTLQIVRECIETGEMIELYRAPFYRENLDSK